MAQLTDLERVRRGRVWRKRFQSLLLLVVFAAVVTAVSLLVYHKGEMDIKTAVGDIKAEISTGTGYPVVLPGGKLLQMVPMDGALAIVADSNLYTYNSTGRRLLDVQHGMANPTVSAAAGRILAYDRGATKVMLFSRSGQLSQIAYSYPICDGDIAKNGNFALASGSDKFLSQVIAYNGEGNIIYHASFADRPVMCVSLADAKEAMTVGLLEVSGGEFLSTIARYQFSVKDPSATLKLPEELLLHLDYSDGDNVRAITDRRAVVFNSDLRELASYSFEEQQLLRCRYGSGGKLLLYLRDATGERRGRAVLLDTRLETLCTIPLDEVPADLALSDGSICIVQNEELFLYDFTGRQTGRFAVNSLGLMMPMGTTFYYTTASELCTIEEKEILERTAQRAAGKAGTPSSAASTAPPADTPAASADGAAPEPGRWELVKQALLGEDASAASASAAPEDAPPETSASQSAAASHTPDDADAAKAPRSSAAEAPSAAEPAQSPAPQAGGQGNDEDAGDEVSKQ